MLNFHPPSPPMSHTEKMRAMLMSPLVDSDVRKQKKIRSLAQSLLKEISLFLEYKVEVEVAAPGVRAELPIFFAKSYNELKRMANKLNYEDAFLNFLPNSVQMQVLTELGPSVVFPKTAANFFLEDQRVPLAEEIQRLQDEVVFFFKHELGSLPRIKELPVAYHLTVKSIQRRAEEEDATKEEKQMAQSINWRMQKVLEDAFPRKVRGGFVEDCVYAHNLDI